MWIAILVLASAADLPSTEYTTGSPKLFEQIAEIDFARDGLRVDVKAGTLNPSTLRQTALSLFPSASRVSIRTNNGSTSTSRGSGSGTVNVQIQNSGTSATFNYQLVSGDGREKVELVQTGADDLRLVIETRGFSLELVQTSTKCTLKVRGGGERVNASGANLTEVFRDNPLGARQHLYDALSSYFGEPPFSAMSTAPPGKTLVRLRDGAIIVGEIELESIVLRTDFGALEIPRHELYHVIFPGAGAEGLPAEASEGEGDEGGPRDASAPASDGKTLVVTRRFKPRGFVDLEKVPITTRYGSLEISASDILQISFGPAAKPSGGEEPAGE